jgi:hypothetical protein
MKLERHILSQHGSDKKLNPQANIFGHLDKNHVISTLSASSEKLSSLFSSSKKTQNMNPQANFF